MKRWPQLAERKPQHLSKKRAEGANYETIYGFFERVEKLVSDLGILYADDLTDQLWNCDGSGLCNAVATGKVLAKRGSEWVHNMFHEPLKQAWKSRILPQHKRKTRAAKLTQEDSPKLVDNCGT